MIRPDNWLPRIAGKATSRELALLLVIANTERLGGPLDMGSLGFYSGMSRTTVQRTLNSLEGKGWLRRDSARNMPGPVRNEYEITISEAA